MTTIKKNIVQTDNKQLTRLILEKPLCPTQATTVNIEVACPDGTSTFRDVSDGDLVDCTTDCPTCGNFDVILQCSDGSQSTINVNPNDVILVTDYCTPSFDITLECPDTTQNTVTVSAGDTVLVSDYCAGGSCNITVECIDGTQTLVTVNDGDILLAGDYCSETQSCTPDANRLSITEYYINADDTVTPPPLGLPGVVLFKHTRIDGVPELTSYPTIDVLKSQFNTAIQTYCVFGQPCNGLTLPDAQLCNFIIEVLDNVCDYNIVQWNLTGTVLLIPVNITIDTLATPVQGHRFNNNMFNGYFTKDKLELSINRIFLDKNIDGSGLVPSGTGLTLNIECVIDGTPVANTVDFLFDVTDIAITPCQ